MTLNTDSWGCLNRKYTNAANGVRHIPTMNAGPLEHQVSNYHALEGNASLAAN